MADSDETVTQENPDEGNDNNAPKITKDDLTNKYRAGRDEGIDKGVRDTLKTVNSVLGTEFDSIDTLKQGLGEVHVGDVEETEVVTELKEKLAAKDEKISNLSSKIQDFRVSSTMEKEISSSLGDKELIIPKEDAKVLFNANYGYVESGGKLLATKGGEKFLNDNGDFATVGEAFSKFATERGLIKKSAQGGAGGGSQERSTDSNNPFVTGNKTAQAKLFREDKAKFDRLKEQAKRK